MGANLADTQKGIDSADWSSKLCLMMGVSRSPKNLELASKFLDHYQVASGKDLAEHIALTESSEWRKAVQNELVNLHILNNTNEENPWKALQDIIEWNQKIALDPAVSKEARDLVIVREQALTEAVISLKAVGHPAPNDPPDAHICGVIARGSLVRVANTLGRGGLGEVAKRLGLVKAEE